MQDFVVCDPGPFGLPNHLGVARIGVLNCDGLADALFIWHVVLACPLVLRCHLCFKIHTHKQEHIYMVRECVVELQAVQGGQQGNNRTVSSM